MDTDPPSRYDSLELTDLPEDFGFPSMPETTVNCDFLSGNEFTSYSGGAYGNLQVPVSPATNLNPQSHNISSDPSFISYRTEPEVSMNNSSGMYDDSTLRRNPYLLSTAGNNGETCLPSLPMPVSMGNLQNFSSSSDYFVAPHQANGLTNSSQLQVSVPDARENDESHHLQKKRRLDEDISLRDMIMDIVQDQKMKKRQPQLAGAQLCASENQQTTMVRPAIPPSQKLQVAQQLSRSQGMQPGIGRLSIAPVVGGGPCYRRLMMYLHEMRSRPPDNNITYWRRFVARYYGSNAKKKWCFSKYQNLGDHPHGIFSRATLCGVCGSAPGKCVDATFEVLPKLYMINFDGGLVDELLSLDLPCEFRLPSGLTVLRCKRAVMASDYPNFRVVREGELCIIFSEQLKIISWEFCGLCHEELVSRRSIAAQLYQHLHTAKKYQSNTEGNQPSRVSEQGLLSDCNRFVVAGDQLEEKLELNGVNDLGFSKRAEQYLLVGEVVNYMKDLVSYSLRNNISPAGSWKRFKEVHDAKRQMVHAEGPRARTSN